MKFQDEGQQKRIAVNQLPYSIAYNTEQIFAQDLDFEP